MRLGHKDSANGQRAGSNCSFGHIKKVSFVNSGRCSGIKRKGNESRMSRTKCAVPEPKSWRAVRRRSNRWPAWTYPGALNRSLAVSCQITFRNKIPTLGVLRRPAWPHAGVTGAYEIPIDRIAELTSSARRLNLRSKGIGAAIKQEMVQERGNQRFHQRIFENADIASSPLTTRCTSD